MIGEVSPYSRVCHNAPITGSVVEVLASTTTDRQWRDDVSSDDTDTRAVRHPNQRQKHADAHTACRLESARNDLDQPVPHSGDCQEDEDEALDEDSSKRKTIRHRTRATDTDNLIREVRIETHSGAVLVLVSIAKFQLQGNIRQGDRKIGQEAKEDAGKAR